jgi:lipopolysaccharide cholinephosphotransferase
MKLTIGELQEVETEIVKEISEICKKNNIDYFLHCGSALGAIRHGGPIPWDTDVDIIVPYNQYETIISTLRRELSDKFYVDYYDENIDYPALFARIGVKGYSSHVLHVDIFKLVGIPSDIKQRDKFIKKAQLYRNLYLPQKRTEKYFGKTSSLLRKTIGLAQKIILFPFSVNVLREKFERMCGIIPYEQAEYVTNLNGHYGTKNIVPKSYYGKGVYVNYSGIDVKIPEQYEIYLRHYYGDYMTLPNENNRKVKDYYTIIKQ